MGTVRGVLVRAGSVVGELGVAVVVWVRHEHHRLEVEGLAGSGEAASVTHEAGVHLSCEGKAERLGE